MDVSLSQSLVDSVRDVCLFGTSVWMAVTLKYTPEQSVEATAALRTHDVKFIVGSPLLTVGGRDVSLTVEHAELLAIWVMLRDRKATQRGDFLLPGPLHSLRYSPQAARKKMGKILWQIQQGADESLLMCGAPGHPPNISDAFALFRLRGGAQSDAKALLDYIDMDREKRMATKAAEDMDAEVVEENIPQPKAPIKTVVFGGHPEFIERKYAPALARYGLHVIKNYPFNVRGRKNVTLPTGTDLVLVVKDMVGHSGSTGANAALDIARAQSKPWVAVPRKIAQAVSIMREKGILPIPQAPQVAKEGTVLSNRPQHVARAHAWEEWRNRRIEAVMSGPSVLFDHKERRYRALPCPVFDVEAHHFDKDHLLVVYLSEEGPVYCSKQSKHHKIYLAAEDAWANRNAVKVPPIILDDPFADVPEPAVEEQDVEVAAPVVVAAPAPVVVPSDKNTQPIHDTMMELAPPVKKSKPHPHDDMMELVHMLTETMHLLGYDSVLVGADGSLSIYRTARPKT